MSKFKLNDRVRSTKEEESFGVRKGYTGTVAEDDSACPYVIWDDEEITGHIALLEDDMELVEKAHGFKVGDRVRITQRKPGNTNGLADWNKPNGDVGKVGTVTAVKGTIEPYKIEEDYTRTYLGYFDADDLELVDTKPELAKPEKPEFKKEKKPMATQYYRVKQDLPDLEAGAILKQSCGSYEPITDLWNTEARDKAVEEGDNVTWEPRIVENAKDWFERVYEVGLLGKTKYLVKSKAQAAYAELHKSGKDTKD